MVMIAHQHPRVHPPASPFARLSQSLVKQEPIAFIAENALSSIPSRHYVVKRPAILDPDRPCHDLLFNSILRACQDLLTDPYYSLHSGISNATSTKNDPITLKYANGG